MSARSTIVLLALVTSCASSRAAQDHARPVDPPQIATVASQSVAIAEVAPPTVEPEDDSLVLPIPDRQQHAQSPKSGWCGETAIQEALLHLGMWAPQRAIHAAGKSKHPDLYSDEIPVALANLGVQYAFYAAKKGNFATYEAWIADALAHDRPVLAGVKLLPTEHPDWGLDHFVLVVGQGTRGLLVNTTWGRQEWAKDTTTPGISFKDVYYGIRIVALALPKGASAARMEVLDETASQVKVKVACAGFAVGDLVTIERRRHAWDAKPLESTTITATSSTVERTLTLDADDLARFDCAR